MASISHTSITGRKKSFERTRLIKRHVGTANSNEAADASRFLVFNRLNSAKTLQRKNNGESGRWSAGRQDITIAFEQTAQHIQKRENENAECKQRAEQAFFTGFQDGEEHKPGESHRDNGKRRPGEFTGNRRVDNGACGAAGQQQQRKCNGAPAAHRTCRGFCFAVRILQGILPACRRAFGFCIALLTVQQFMDGYAEYVCNGG